MRCAYGGTRGNLVALRRRRGKRGRGEHNRKDDDGGDSFHRFRVRSLVIWYAARKVARPCDIPLRMTDWKTNLITDSKGILDVIRDTKTIAVLGIKPETHADQAAFYVPAHMAAAGYEVVPVPVYYPDVTEILGKRVFRKLTDIKSPIDMVNVFRRPN